MHEYKIECLKTNLLNHSTSSSLFQNFPLAPIPIQNGITLMIINFVLFFLSNLLSYKFYLYERAPFPLVYYALS